MDAFAVYGRPLAYTDEFFYFQHDRRLNASLEVWRAGGNVDFEADFLAMLEEAETPDELISTYATLAEADAAATREHAKRSESVTMVDLGFGSFGLSGPSYRYYEGDDEPDSPYANEPPSAFSLLDDQEILQSWCFDHGVAIPKTDGSLDATIRERAVAVAERSIEGHLWLDFVEDNNFGVFAADFVLGELRAAGENDKAAELVRYLVGELTYVGPAISQAPSEVSFAADIAAMREYNTSQYPASASATNAPVAPVPIASAASVPVADEPKGFFQKLFKRG
jgi:hypothetical protein